ncbi:MULTISPECIES: 4-alpha-glucanotransferase [unclassified Tolypothrix]|uniref:4-alpha-glucanotransferase n=1 Tax=unclassified Tolypothrix TaxID=2649714 RepID=UPI0005EAC3E9|nr:MULTISPECIES: 4-alpha-glucanotransferase [unclassified Tolypothrix]BAY91700.1 4-alpha-glucanotransferase [Microchaete diplosiphon NIES-3275]EKF05177.1 4-alpha-glucanotransferase [Tolypothrix sp. PCC 7601]MBE9084324.1 4-alpha-glucanotransferase [Tolypothrix sp. LEGE 11397]UYD25716.1 4-alpha-glucanotransferase [Tolypothrix sp. PCC 7712]UYD32043.1 4-alpha-glucanotransferase [Tolypothrix sp. PCC 7601]
MPFPRSSGILLHPTSFPSRFGIGDLGLEAYRFIDFLKDSYQQYWQVLPLGPTGYGNSPYMSYSAMAGNPLLISPEQLLKDDLLTEEDFANLPGFPANKVDFEQIVPIKNSLLQKACENFHTKATSTQQKKFAEFCDRKAYWLDDYALFMALKDTQNGASWHTWEPEVAKRQPEALDRVRRQLTQEIFYYKFIQYEFFQQWSELKTYANKHGIDIIGDIPIYVAHDSADVWANPDIFALDEETGEASQMAGVPPDYFSATGQLWGNPVYNWEELQKQDFKWWLQRFEAMLDYVDIIRIDHFRGFEAYWSVPQGEETAINGEWIEAPGGAFFETIRQKLGKLPVLAEDLGVITPEVEALRDKFEFPGMKVLQFAFGSDPGNPFLPFNYPRNAVVYTGTHDNDTTIGWFNKAGDWEKENLLLYLGCVSPDGIHWDLIRLALSSIANQAILPLQDILGLGGEARMNFPSVAEGNWEWRYQENALTKELSHKLKRLTTLYGRAPKESS